jgi:tRNA 2-(methylsulfanyl)-N6-isopentenyladenosine37 hydroxylase
VLGLTVPTDPQWVKLALDNLSRILVDHAHCELKAASNALSLVTRYADDTALVLALTALAQEELLHFARAIGFLTARGLTLGAPQVNDYAKLLRNAAADLPARHIERLVLVDRLLTGALIEARSCERFKLLAQALDERAATTTDVAQAVSYRQLGAFYMELFTCEARHYRTYVDLAKLAASTASVAPGQQQRTQAGSDVMLERRAMVPTGVHTSADAIEERLGLLARAEGAIVARLSHNTARAMIHG